MTQISKAVEGARRAAIGGLTDAELLSCFLDRQDEAAFAALVQRHGRMVWSVCRRALDHHQAEDAFQAVFLVLFRRAGAIRPRSMVANWLYGVAHQTALHVRRTNARRIKRERQVPVMPEPAAKAMDAQLELHSVLDAELSRLPDHYRAVIVLCDLEGKTRIEAARQLGRPEGTVAGHLARGRAMLARRLRRHGLGVSGAALAAVLAQQASAVPPSIISSTSATIPGQAVPAKVAVLAEGVIKAMLVTKLKMTLAIVLVLGLTVTGASFLTSHSAGQTDQKPAAEKPMEPAPRQDKEPFTAWGKVVGGLQAGLGFRPGEHRAYHWGEMVRLVVRVRNVGKEKIDFQYLNQYFVEKPPAVKDDHGKPFPSAGRTALGIHIPVKVSLAEGKEIELYELQLKLRGPSLIPQAVSPDMLVGVSGKVSVQYERVFGDSSSGTIKLDPTLSKLATGKLELEIKSDPPPGDTKKPRKNQEEPVTAWGKEVGGLQAGLEIRPGKRVYHHGETVTLLVRVRNVSKETVKFEYIRQFLDENPPTVTDAAGKVVAQARFDMLGEHGPVAVSVEPGKDIVLESRLTGASGLRYGLRPDLGIGKVSFQYERVLGNSSSGFIKLDPALSKLGTGKLEIEVRPAAEKK